ncbi:MAG TPA: TfoX/Sxy family protein [Hyphomicrobiaceae bacterium]|nr:TfoX/Sxy family protein [Hyphomicrobiaceae bacterium]
MAINAELAELIRDALESLGSISIRRMFSGAGVFCDGLMLALIVGDELYLKADAASIPEFEAEGLEPFRYATKEGERTLSSYWRAPERLLDEPDEMLAWGRKAFEAARRAAKAQARSATKSPRPRRTKAAR